MPKTPTKPPSDSGYWQVDLAKPFERRGFTYKPGISIRVNEAVLDEMIAAEKVQNIVAAD